jgi:hypothetical protein
MIVSLRFFGDSRHRRFSFKGDQGVAYRAVIGTRDDERVYNLAGPLPMKILSWREVR